jgi:hypothetical protein
VLIGGPANALEIAPCVLGCRRDDRSAEGEAPAARCLPSSVVQWVKLDGGRHAFVRSTRGTFVAYCPDAPTPPCLPFLRLTHSRG